MRFLWFSFNKDMMRLRRDPLGLVLSATIPIAIALILKLVFGGEDAALKASVWVADHDQSPASALLVGALGQGPAGELMDIQQVPEDVGRRRLNQGKGTALIVVPKGFGQGLLEEVPQTLLVETNPSQQILPGIVIETLSMTADVAFYSLGLFGPIVLPVIQGADGAPNEEQVSAAASRVNAVMSKVGPRMNPSLISVSVEADASEESFDFGSAFLPGMLFLAILFFAQGFSGDIWVEQHQGTLRRVQSGPGLITPFFAGKVLALVLACGVLGVIGLMAGRWLFGIQIHNFALGAVWIALAGGTLFLIMTLVQTLAGSSRAGSTLTTLIIFPLAMLGGSFFPFEAMPDFMAKIGRWTPNGWALTIFKQLCFEGGPFPWIQSAAALAVAALFLALCISRIRLGYPRDSHG